MQSITCLLAAGILLLPVSGTAAEKETEIHAVMAAEESHGEAAASEQRTASAAKDAQETVDTEKTTDRAQTTAEPAAKDRAASEQCTQEDAFDAEMDELGTENPPAEQTPQTNAASARDAEAKTKTKTAEETADGEGTAEAVLVKEPAKEKEPAAAATDGAGHSAVSAEPAKKTDAADKKAEKKHAAAAADAAKREAYGKETAIEPVTLKDGDWVFIEGDERRGWFFDRSRMKRNADGSVSYWQLILYNNLGRAQFAEAMKNADYEHLGYTMQRRVLSPKKDAISTYEILAYDGNSALITESSREGHRAVIRANTMTEKERDAVRQELRRKK
ncbi:cell division protein [Selenomonas felix]|uniref:cell division protein n=1 Tax=Selenomonas felix TaxID=1944634 RepID=UPI000C853FFD|nr:cell division protein [Selenomonas felix]